MTWSRRWSAACASKVSGSSRRAAASRAATAQRSEAVALMAVAEALSRVLAGGEPPAAAGAPLPEGHARVLAADVRAGGMQPPADVSAMDGYAVRAADVATVPVHLKLIGEVAAGHPFKGTVGAGEAARIFTGGVVPAGADT